MKLKFSNLKTSCLVMLFIALCQFSLAAQTPDSPINQANALFQAQKWAEAAAAYEAIVKGDPSNGRAWFQLAWARQGLGQYKEALDALEKPLQASKGTPREAAVDYAAATMYAGLKDNDKAIEYLNKALAAKFGQPRTIAFDPNLKGLHDDPRFKEVLAAAAKMANVCMNTPEYRGFDFWVGEWDVLGKGGQKVGASKVDIVADGCIVSENWDNLAGGVGKSYNFYNPVTKKWHQSYMDNSGGNWMMDGELKDGALRYEGAIYSPTGKVLVHMTFYNLGPDKVRQTAETSNDDGKTWTPVWDGMYVRKK